MLNDAELINFSYKIDKWPFDIAGQPQGLSFMKVFQVEQL